MAAEERAASVSPVGLAETEERAIQIRLESTTLVQAVPVASAAIPVAAVAEEAAPRSASSPFRARPTPPSATAFRAEAGAPAVAAVLAVPAGTRSRA